MAQFHRVFRIAALVLIAFGSLLAFPSVLPLVFLCYLVALLLLIWKNRSGWQVTTAVFALVAFKWPEFHWSLMLMCGVCLAASGFAVFDQAAAAKKRNASIVAAVSLAWCIYAICHWTGANASQSIPVAADRPIVCVGDSLTDFGYPQELEKLISVPIIDLGFNGYTTDDAIQLLPKITSSNPQAVIIEIGGHDYKDGRSRWYTRKNLVLLIEACLAVDAVVILVEIPRGLVNDPYRGLERELARQFDLQLIPDTMVRRLIYWSPILPPGMWTTAELHNSADGLHPNERGNQMMARYVVDALRKVFGPDIQVAP